MPSLNTTAEFQIGLAEMVVRCRWVPCLAHVGTSPLGKSANSPIVSPRRTCDLGKL